MNIAKVQKTYPKPPGFSGFRQSNQQVGDLYIVVAQLRAVALAGLADPEGPAGQSNADPTSRHRRFGHLAALTPGKCWHLPSGQRTARLLFSKGLFQQLVLHAEFGEHLIQAPVLLFDRLRMGNRRSPWSLGPVALPWRDIPHTSPAIYRTTRSLSWFAGKTLPGNGIMPCARIARICGLVYLLVFIRILLLHLAEKILLMQTLTFRGITRSKPTQN